MNLTPTQENPLVEQLHDILLPEAIGWWPLAASVWVVMIIFIGIIIGLIVYFYHRYQQHKYRRDAVIQINTHSGEINDREFITMLNGKLKQVAITTYGRYQVAALNDQAWLDFLADKALFIPQPSSIKLLTQHYTLDHKDISPTDRQALLNYAQQWIKEHHL